jgi:LmbE family N-acetylglucosaminyl deacetylase
MKENILGKSILVLVAHPDDESFLAAGTLHENKIRGGHNYLLCASKGELGYSYIVPSPSTAELKKMRERELIKASKHVGVDALQVLNHRDGGLSVGARKLEKEFFKFARSYKFNYVMSFGEDGYTGHSDHVVVSHIAKKLARDHHVPLLQFAKLPARICRDIDKHLLVKRKNGTYSDECGGLVVPNLRISIDPFVKLKSLCIHKSQFAGLDPYRIFPKKTADHFLRNEYFYLSRP